MKVLMVSDDELFARLAAHKLENWGHNCTIESSATDAFERIKKEPFRVVITGWDVPGMTGPDLCRKIRALNRDRYTYVIIYTSKSDKDSVMAGLEAGADDYLTRPFNAAELKLRITNGKRLLNLEDELREGAGTDSSTGLVNGASFRQFFRVVLAETIRLKMRGALMYVSVETYRETLTDYGYVPAQNTMTEISKALQRSTRDSDLVARVSDEEFCLLLQNTWWDQCIRVAEKVAAQIDNMSFLFEDVELRPKVRIGTVNYPVDELSSDDILALPDRIAYEP